MNAERRTSWDLKVDWKKDEGINYISTDRHLLDSNVVTSLPRQLYSMDTRNTSLDRSNTHLTPSTAYTNHPQHIYTLLSPHPNSPRASRGIRDIVDDVPAAVPRPGAEPDRAAVPVEEGDEADEEDGEQDADDEAGPDVGVFGRVVGELAVVDGREVVLRGGGGGDMHSRLGGLGDIGVSEYRRSW